MSDEGSVAERLDDRPELAEDLKSVLAVDDRQETWSFDDVPIDSGQLGELVSRGLVESVGDEYRLANPEESRAVLDGDRPKEIDSTTVSAAPTIPNLATFDARTVAIIAAAVALVGAVRIHPFASIFRNSDIVLSGNDAYYYRHWVEQVLATGIGTLHGSGLGALDAGVRNGEPLMVATLSSIAAVFGGSPTASGHVLAWYPVASAVVTAALLYLVAVRVTDDRRIALASLLFFAIVPGHAMRTSLGFADHHAFDYPWLAATALGLVVLATAKGDDLRSTSTWIVSGLLGVAVAGQVLAWSASPLLLVPIGLVVVALTTLDVREDRPSLGATAPIAGGLAVASAITAAVHVGAGWHEPAVAFAPALLLGGVLGAVGVAVAVRRTTGDPRHVLALDGALGAVGLLVVSLGFPSAWNRLTERFGSLLGGGEIAETVGLFDPASFGFLFLFGFTLVLAIPAMAWGIRRSMDDRRWAIVTVYAWFFLGLATVQSRFVGELAPFAAFFAGVGFVAVAAWVDAIRPLGEAAGEHLRIPDRKTLGTLAVLFLLFGSLGAIQTPIKTSQLTIEDGTYHSATFVEDRVAERGQTYQDDRVLSRWGRNRVYNYFAFGQSRSYQYARQNYEEFVLSSDPDGLYDRLDGEVGYVVIDNSSVMAGPESAASRLTDSFGSRTDEYPGIAHYRPLYVPPSGDRLVLELVPGARVTGTGPANATVTLSTDISIEGANFTYERQTTTEPDGSYAVHVPNPGEYAVAVGDATERVEVTESDVRHESDVSV